MNYLNKFIPLLLLLSLSFLASCGVDLFKLDNAINKEMMASSDCGCTFTFHPVCVVKENISYENICHAKCARAPNAEIRPGRCLHNDNPKDQVCLDREITTTEKAAFELIYKGEAHAITKYSACDRGTY